MDKKIRQTRCNGLIRPIDHCKALTRPGVDVRRERTEAGRLLLSNIGEDIFADDITMKFSEYGKVDYVDIHENKCNGLRTGTAEVWMNNGTTADCVKKAFNGYDVFDDGRLIRIEKPSLLTPVFWKTVCSMLKLAKSDK